MDEKQYNMLNYGLGTAAVGSGVVIIGLSAKTDENSVTAFRVLYTVLFCIMLAKSVISCSRSNIDDSDSSKFSKIIQIIYPFLPILSIIFIIMVILHKYYDRIVGGNVSDYYTSFMFLASLLIMIQVYVIFKELTATNLFLSKKIASMLRLLGILAFLSVITVHIVLKFYVTDC
jgi:hypothetical protein